MLPIAPPPLTNDLCIEGEKHLWLVPWLYICNKHKHTCAHTVPYFHKAEPNIIYSGIAN